ncbi:MAG: type 1 glutamine amidotransferase [bacterium]|nr:type 1 glutamine amidotransferase [bacterium]
MNSMLRLLVLDAYASDGRAKLALGGAAEAGPLYAECVHALAPTAKLEIGHPADADWVPPASLEDFDGMLWSGSSLTIHIADDPRVRRQVELARRGFEAGIPAHGSCWAAQLAVVSAGGQCGLNPKGREFGLSRKIRLTTGGADHPMYQGKPAVFDAWTSHQDEIQSLPPGAKLLATNEFTRVQAVAIEHGRGRFWAVQYHPEYDLHEIARQAHLRTPGLVEQGSFADEADAEGWIRDMEALHANPDRSDIAWRYGIDTDVVDPAIRLRELANWLANEVEPRARQRVGGSRGGSIRGAG